jgi:hypothetical protein
MDNVINHIIVEVSETRFLSRMFSSEAENMVQKLVGHLSYNSQNQSINPLKVSQPLPQVAQLNSENMSHKLFLFKNINYIPIIQPIINI